MYTSVTWLYAEFSGCLVSSKVYIQLAFKLVWDLHRPTFQFAPFGRGHKKRIFNSNHVLFAIKMPLWMHRKSEVSIMHPPYFFLWSSSSQHYHLAAIYVERLCTRNEAVPVVKLGNLFVLAWNSRRNKRWKLSFIPWNKMLWFSEDFNSSASAF